MAIKSVGGHSAGQVSEVKTEKKEAAPEKEASLATIIDEAKARSLVSVSAPCGVTKIFRDSSLNTQQELATKVLIAAAAMVMNMKSHDLKS